MFSKGFHTVVSASKSLKRCCYKGEREREGEKGLKIKGKSTQNERKLCNPECFSLHQKKVFNKYLEKIFTLPLCN